MPKQAWYFVGIFSALVIIAVLALGLQRRNENLLAAKAELERAVQALDSAKQEIAHAKQEIGDSSVQIEKLRSEKEQAVQARTSFEQEMRTALESRDVTISELQGKLTVNILDRILFDSGEATLRQEGEAVLRKVAAVLNQYPTRMIHVIGHTDNVPIRASSRNKYPSNWELAMARATSAVRFLSEQAGVAPQRLGAVGYGEFRPLADNATPEGRAKNRRIAIVVLSEELAGSDAAAAARLTPPRPGQTQTPPVNGTTNLPPTQAQPPPATPATPGTPPPAATEPNPGP